MGWFQRERASASLMGLGFGGSGWRPAFVGWFLRERASASLIRQPFSRDGRGTGSAITGQTQSSSSAGSSGSCPWTVHLPGEAASSEAGSGIPRSHSRSSDVAPGSDRSQFRSRRA
ncbi:hypothetical protein Q5425_16335 [Amycolatopsis sp. A133]|uniref:hypothetical protein n=1 Tax=Amycolatopsis sp. A133 TaxID=3064472 RepID=UPI0027F90EB2|nr:hypothetical protein [Amycolatopsis sp. A133]MDQ7805316.1 hypothetical protein [Amycolatopsis sp. A133]